MEPLNIGIDLGSFGLRVAYVIEGHGAVSVEQKPLGEGGWLLCEPSSSSRVGVSFPSVKRRLVDSDRPGGAEGGLTSYQVLTAALAGARSSVEERVGRPVGQVVLCVPARYHTSQRAAVRDAALAAGFDAAHLINDSVSVVIAHARDRLSPATVLVFGVGYEGFELSLVRVAKGHVRVLAYEGGAMAGAALDLLVLEGWADALAAEGLALHGAHTSTSVWMTLRAAAQTVKERLGTNAEVTVGLCAQPGLTVTASFRRGHFEEAVRLAFQPAIGRVHNLLENAGMTRADVDVVVLSGGTTQIPTLRRLLGDALGSLPVLAPADLPAHGAALHAVGLDSKPGQVLLDERLAEAEERNLSPADRVALPASTAFTDRPPADTVFLSEATLSAGELAVDEVGRKSWLFAPGSLGRHVARLVEAGEVERARAGLDELIREARAVLDGLPDVVGPAELGPTSPAYRSQLALSNARSYLERRAFAQAVSESHYAWKIAPDDPKILEEMINVHCRAAMANAAPEQYEDAIRWLTCAFGHDESNARTRSLLAERHYLQARELRHRGHAQEALEAAERCLLWDPDYPDAAELQRVLTAEKG